MLGIWSTRAGDQVYPSRIRLSTSAHDLLRQCERKFQLTYLLRGGEERDDEESPIFSFGHAWGAGVVNYLLSGRLDEAMYRAWLAYWPNLEDHQRCEELVFYGLRAAQPKLDKIRQGWEIATFKDKPAIELGFHLDINDRWFYQSAIDAVMVQKSDTPRYAVLENKHTMSWKEDIMPMYKNSGQALCYSIVVDEVAQQPILEFPVHYFVGQFMSSDLYKPRIHHFEWKKTLLDRLNWFISLGMDVNHGQQCLDLNIFPMRGGSCNDFGKVCPYFGDCQLRANDVPKTDADFERDKTSHVKEIEASIQFRFDLNEVISRNLQKVREEIERT